MYKKLRNKWIEGVGFNT